MESTSDFVALHDVDLLPLNDKLSYAFPPYPMHISAPWLHPSYHYKTFIGCVYKFEEGALRNLKRGRCAFRQCLAFIQRAASFCHANRGILLMANEHFRRINGLSTNFWGWGRVGSVISDLKRHASYAVAFFTSLTRGAHNPAQQEDDELYKRIVEGGLKVDRPPKDIGTDTTNTFRHLHDADARPRDTMKVGKQYLQGKERDTQTGLDTAKVRHVATQMRDCGCVF
jgi:xylosylprotein 4-beta-galactosyltransferase